MSLRVDSLNIFSNTKPLPLDAKPINNEKIEVFATDSKKANIDEVNFSNQNNNNQVEEKTDNKKKWLIGAGIVLGTAAVAIASYFLFKKASSINLGEKIFEKPNELRISDDIVGKLVSSKKPTFNEIAKKFTSEWGRNFTPDEIKNITTKYNIDANDLVDIIACNRPMEEGNNMKIFNEFFNIMDSKSPTLTHRIQGIKKSVLSLPRNIIKSFKNAWTLFLFKIRK